MHLKYSFKKKTTKSIDHIFGFCRASSIPLLQAEVKNLSASLMQTRVAHRQVVPHL